jgi:hypothetical protein
MHRITHHLLLLAAGLGMVLISGCERRTQAVVRQFGFDEFVPVYNRHIQDWLVGQEKAALAALENNAVAIANAEGEAKARLEIQTASLQRDLAKWQFRLAHGDYIKFRNVEDVPTDLVWENGMDQPEIGDPAAKKAASCGEAFPGLIFHRPSARSGRTPIAVSAVISMTTSNSLWWGCIPER